MWKDRGTKGSRKIFWVNLKCSLKYSRGDELRSVFWVAISLDEQRKREPFHPKIGKLSHPKDINNFKYICISFFFSQNNYDEITYIWIILDYHWKIDIPFFILANIIYFIINLWKWDKILKFCWFCHLISGNFSDVCK